MQEFDSQDHLLKWCQETGLKIRVVVVKVKSERPIEGFSSGRLELGCERGGKYRRNPKCKPRDDKNARQSGTKKCGCPFLLKGYPISNGKWRVTVKCGLHNHGLGNTLVGHTYAGRLKQEEIEFVKQMTFGGSAPRDILVSLKEKFKENMSTKKQLYNTRNKLKLLDMRGMSQIQYLMGKLIENGYMYYHVTDETRNVITNLFWCKKESIEMFRCFPHVLVLDCTYKTNKYKLPLFEIVGQSSTGHTFNVAFVFMEHEREENYKWALQRLETVVDTRRPPNVFVTDKENALINAIKSTFPNASK